jgi:hydroxyacylglutathione hydrolase
MEITPPIHGLRLPFWVPVSPNTTVDRFVNIYLIYGRTITLIDTGVAGCEVPIFDSIRSQGRDPSEIGQIILTHSHPDHIGAARAIQRINGCRIAAHPLERAWIEDVELQNRERPVPGFDVLVGGSVHIDQELKDGDWIGLEGSQGGDMQIIHTPGHSPGSISIFRPQEGALFTGDAIPVRGNLPVYEDPQTSVYSIQRLRRLAGIKVLLSAWDELHWGKEAYRQMDQGLAYLQDVHQAVLVSERSSAMDLVELTRKTSIALGLPGEGVNPLLTRTFASNLRYRDRKNLLR